MKFYTTMSDQLIKWVLVVSLLANGLALGVGLWSVQRLGGWKYLWYRFRTQGIGASYVHRKSQLDMLPTKRADIVMWGNSLTRQGEWQEWLPEFVVCNRGIEGDHVAGLMARMDQVVALQPRWVLLMIGVNDLLFHEPDFVLSQYELLLQKLVAALPQSHIIVQSLLPVNNEVRPLGISNEDIDRVNEGLVRLSARYGLRYLDLHALLCDAQGRLDARFTRDGIHINGAAYRIWVQAIRAELQTSHSFDGKAKGQ